MTPIAMKCSQERWEEIKPLLEKGGLDIVCMGSFNDSHYLVNNYNNRLGKISNIHLSSVSNYERTVHHNWDTNTFLEACDLPTISTTPLYTIEDLSNGKCAVINDGTPEELGKVLKIAFPIDVWKIGGRYMYYCKCRRASDQWIGYDDTDLPTQSVKDFLKQIEVALPEKWCIKVTDDNVKILDEWRGSSYKSLPIEGYCINSRHHSRALLTGYWCPSYQHVPFDYQHEITTNQFKEYIFKQETKETVEYKGQLKGFPKEVVERMLQHQVTQGNKKDVTVFETSIYNGSDEGGFSWYNSSEGDSFWNRVIIDKNFDVFFEKYPKNNDMVTDSRFPFSLAPENAQQIIDIACNRWKTKLATMWANDIVLSKQIEIAESFYKEMRKACTAEQNALFDKIFGKDIVECPYKVGDYIVIDNDLVQITSISADHHHDYWIRHEPISSTGGGFGYRPYKHRIKTATQEEINRFLEEINRFLCPYKDGELIWVKIDGIWELRYSNGTLDKEGNAYIYKNQKREGRIYRFSQHQKANNIELPKD